MLNNTRKIIISLLIAATTTYSFAQNNSLGKGIYYSAELNGTASTHESPFWLSANKYGLSSIEEYSGYLRATVGRSVNNDSTRRWRIGYAADIAALQNHDSKFVIQQLYADLQYKILRLTVGAKEYDMELRNDSLSTGKMTEGINSRPIPQVRISLPEFVSIPGTHDWMAVKAHVAYGITTDGNWQQDFTGGNTLYSKRSIYHTKAGYLRIGNEKHFPVTLTGGLEMCAQFGGEAWNLSQRQDYSGSAPFDSHQKLGQGIKDFWNAFIPGGSDVNDGDYSNIEGNQLGDWTFRLSYHAPQWSAHAYMEHYFDDHSQMFFQYGWKDMMWGLEFNLPRRWHVHNVVMEYVGTRDQSGCIYHDVTAQLPYQISGSDNYYNHQVYGSWQHWGQNIGSPLILSPIYNANQRLHTYSNRIRSFHLGIDGSITSELDWRIMLTSIKSWGTYNEPLISPKHFVHTMAEITWHPKHLLYGSWARLQLATSNRTNLYSDHNSIGCSLTLGYTMR